MNCVSVREGRGPNPENESKTIGIMLPLGQSYDVDISLKKEQIDLNKIPLPGHSNGSLEPPKKFTAVFVVA